MLKFPKQHGLFFGCLQPDSSNEILAFFSLTLSVTHAECTIPLWCMASMSFPFKARIGYQPASLSLVVFTIYFKEVNT